jgi:hypothetical protein
MKLASERLEEEEEKIERVQAREKGRRRREE